MRMLLRPKNLPLVRSLNSLFEISGLIEGLQLGNFHKWLALHLDEPIMAYLSHVHMVWKERICESRQAVMRAIGVDDVRMLQFRMPKVSSEDADTIGRLLDDGTLFPRIGDPGAREMLRRNILSLDVVIPSLETFQENMHYIAIGAKTLIQHVVGKIPICKSRTKRSPTIFELLSSSWTAPDVLQVEVADDKAETVEGRASPSLAFTQLFLVCLRLFPWLQDAYAPREDWPEDNFKAGVTPPCVTYLQHFALAMGFRTPMTIEAQSRTELYPGPQWNGPWETLPDWRGGRPFTRTFWTLRANAFLPRLHVAATRRHHPNPEFVLLDMVTAFFGKQDFTLKDSPNPPEDIPFAEDISLDEGDSLGEEDQEMGDRPADAEGHKRRQETKPKARPAKHIRPAARRIANREAARSVMGIQAVQKSDKTRPKKTLPAVFPPRLLQVLKESGTSESKTAQNAKLNSKPQFDFTPTAALKTATFGREATRSVFAQIPKSNLRKPAEPPLRLTPNGNSLVQPPLLPTAPLSGARGIIREPPEDTSRPFVFLGRSRAIAPIRRMITSEVWRTEARSIPAPTDPPIPLGLHKAGVHSRNEDPTLNIRGAYAQAVAAKKARHVGEFNPSSEDQPSSSATLLHPTTTDRPEIQHEHAADISDTSSEIAQPSPVSSSTPTPPPEKLSTDDKGKQIATTTSQDPGTQETEAVFSAQSDHFPGVFARLPESDRQLEVDENDSPLLTPIQTGTGAPELTTVHTGTGAPELTTVNGRRRPQQAPNRLRPLTRNLPKHSDNEVTDDVLGGIE